MNIAKRLVDSLKSKKQPSAYDTPAVVTRIEGSTAWVRIAGGIDETPVQKTIDAKAGDAVNVRISGGQAWLTGNGTAPPTDDTAAIQVSNNLTTVSKNLNEIIQARTIAIIGDISSAEERAKKTATSYIGPVPGYAGICVFNETSGTPQTFVNIDPSSPNPAMNIIVGGNKKASYGEKTIFYGTNGSTLYQALSIEPLFSPTPDGGTYSGGTIQFSAFDTTRSGPKIEGARYLSNSIYKTGISAYCDTFTVYGTLEASAYKGLPLQSGVYSPSDVSVPTNTWKNCGNFTVPAGSWTITVMLRFAENSSGRRALVLAADASDAASGTPINISAEAVENAVSGARTYLHLTYVTHTTESTTFYIGAVQTSGSSLSTNVRARWAGVREL